MLEKVGLDPEEIVLHPVIYTSPEAVAEAIQRRHREDLPLNAAKLTRGEDRDNGLIEAAVRWFGSWDGALRAAGFDPEEHRIMRAPLPAKEAVVAEIRRRRREGLPVNHSAVSLQDTRLYNAAYRFFQNWDGALRAAGFDPAEVKHAAWSAAGKKSRKRPARRGAGS